MLPKRKCEILPCGLSGFDNEFKFYRGIQRQLSRAQCEAGVTSDLSEYLDKKIGGPVYYLGLLSESGRGGDVTTHPHDSRHLIEGAQLFFDRGECGNGRKFGGLVSLFN